MVTPLLLWLAIGASPPPDFEIVVVDDQPSITIPLGRLDPGKAEDRRRIEQKIHHAAMSVCDRGYRGISYLETVACVKSAIADGDAQLGRLVARGPQKAPVTASIAISLPAN